VVHQAKEQLINVQKPIAQMSKALIEALQTTFDA
jgi:hypothetical protein